MKKLVKPGDTLILHSLDRFGRNYEEILDEWRYFTKINKVNIYIIDMPILDTRGHKDLLSTLISDLVLALLSYVAQQEREFNKMRQAEGIAAAKAKGIKFGRMEQPFPDNFEELYVKYMYKEISSYEIKEQLNISEGKFRYLVRKLRTQHKVA